MRYNALRFTINDGQGHVKTQQEVDARTEGRVQMAPGTLYGAIKRLLEKGLIEETDEHKDPERNDERRRYYRLTTFGQKVLVEEAARLAGLVQQARNKGLLPSLLRKPAKGNA